MPQYDDSFLDSPLFRRRTKSYSVQKQEFINDNNSNKLIKKSGVSATPTLLAVTNAGILLLPAASVIELSTSKGKRDSSILPKFAKFCFLSIMYCRN